MRRRQTRARAPSTARPSQQMTTLLETVSAANPGADLRPIERAYTVAARAHRGQRRKSGDPYITHPIAVATIVAEIDMCSETICAALLHDTVVDTDYSLAGLRQDFGEVVAHLVDGVTELDRVKLGDTVEAETVRRIVLAMARDPRVLVLELADRLHNMRTMRFLPPEQQARKARETLEVFAPVAHQLGMATIKRELEDLASGILHSRSYDARPSTIAERVLAASVVLLPAATRTRWLEEWAGELSALPTRRARARFAVQMLRGMPRLAAALRGPAIRDVPGSASTIVDKIAGLLGIGGAFLAAVTRWELAAWAAGAIVLGGLALLAGVLFARSEDPASRLRGLIRAWRDPVSTPRSSRHRRNRPGP
jgi:HD domain-containing protein